MKRPMLTLLACALFGSFSFAQDAKESTALTIYSSAQPGAVPAELYQPGASASQIYGPMWRTQIPGYAIVKQERTFPLGAGRSKIRFTDVASQIEPTTVKFSSLTDPTGTRILEQSFEFDLVNQSRLLSHFLDRVITVNGTKGTLLSSSMDAGTVRVILREANGDVRIMNGAGDVVLPELPPNLITRPTLVWDVATDKPGDHRTRVTYETKALTWWTDYNLVFAEGKDANSGLLDVGAWVSILNQSGATYNDAKLKLIAGDVQRAPEPSPAPMRSHRMTGKVMAAAEMDAGFEEKTFFEYHLYTLGRPTTIADNSTKQVELFPPAKDVPCEKVLVYYGLGTKYPNYGNPMTDRNFGVQSNQKVDIYLKFKNEKAIGMGMPLPTGRIRVSKLDPADGTLEFIGEDTIDHTAKDETVLIKLGSAFDVVGERKQTDFAVDSTRKWIDEKIEIKVRNHKDEKVKVIVKENLYRWTNWKITEKTSEFEKVDSRTIHFPLEIEKDGEATIRYTVHYSW